MAVALFEALLRASLQGGAYAAAVWGVCRLFPRLPADVRSLLWWLVSLKFLVALAGPAPIPLRVLPAPATLAASPAVIERTATLLPAGHASPEAGSGALAWTGAALWACLLACGLLRGVRDLARARRLRRSATSADTTVEETFCRMRARLGMRADVPLKLSRDVTAPQVLGPWRPLVLLPDGATPLTQDELEMALAHELLHVRRGDLWLALVPELVHALFCFHPLARLAVREERLAREAACDAAVLSALDRAPREYGRLLLRFGIVPSLPGAAQGASSRHGLRRRLEMLDQVHGKTARFAGLALAVFALLALLPFAAVARDGTPASLASSARAEPVFTLVNTPLAVVAPEDEIDVEVDADVDEAESFIVHHGDSTTMFMSADRDSRAFKQLQRKDGDFFYYRDGTRQWVIRDPAILAEALRILEPMQALGNKQGAIGEEQGKIGEKQGDLGEQQGMLGERLGLLAEEQDRERGEIDARMEDLGARMDVLGRQMDELGRKMDALGEAMDEASEQARRDLRRLAEDAVRRGIAQPLSW